MKFLSTAARRKGPAAHPSPVQAAITVSEGSENRVPIRALPKPPHVWLCVSFGRSLEMAGEVAGLFGEPSHRPGLCRCGEWLHGGGRAGVPKVSHRLRTSTYIQQAQFTPAQSSILILPG